MAFDMAAKRLKRLARPERLELLIRFANNLKSLLFHGSRFAGCVAGVWSGDEPRASRCSHVYDVARFTI